MTMPDKATSEPNDKVIVFLAHVTGIAPYYERRPNGDLFDLVLIRAVVYIEADAWPLDAERHHAIAMWASRKCSLKQEQIILQAGLWGAPGDLHDV